MPCIAFRLQVPASLDLISVDYYAGWLPSNATCPLASKCATCPSCPCFNQSGVCPPGATDPPGSEVTFMKAFIEGRMLPAMQPHQNVLAVPGTFGCKMTWTSI